ncbi:MAG: YgjV family protein [Lachnospiraceae bacterium]|nr:YgjV family protein [Lachnospiraceae bacterium]
MTDPKIIVELVGYMGSALVVVSMLMTSVKKLRVVNSVGSIIFTVYALIIHSYPTALMNLCIVIINIRQLIRLSQKERHFQLVKVKAGEGMMGYLLDHYYSDISKFFPELAIDLAVDCDQAYVVTCDTTPAGILLGNEIDDGVIMLLIDYATPAYRDTSVGKFLYKHLPDYGINTLIFSSRSVGHEEYMKQMGFVKEEIGFVKKLPQ